MESDPRVSSNLSVEEKKQLLAKILKEKMEEKLFCLSYGQERLWLLNQLEEEIGAAYHIPQAYRLRGEVDVAALEKSFDEIVSRHEVLRTRFVTRDGQPYQQIVMPTPFKLSVVDLQPTPPERRETKLQQRLSEGAQQPFDLATGPLLQARLFQLGAEEHVLLVTIHHIVFDGWSMSLFWQELATLYETYIAGAATSPLAPLPIQYVDYAQWQREQAQTEVIEKQLAYWQEQLAEAAPVLALPTDKPRPAVQTFRGATHTFTLPPDLVKRLKALGREEEATLFMTVLAAFKVLLHRYTSQADIIVGTPIANRSRVELEGLIGFFVNTLVLRTDLSGNPTFRQLLKRVRETALGAYSHQEVPFAQLVQALQPERNMSHNPLFQVMFSLQNEPDSLPELPGVAIDPVPIDRGAAQFDLSLLLTETEGRLAGNLEFNSNLFTAESIARMGGHLRQLLKGIAANPDQLIGLLPLLTEEERHQILVEWNDTQRDYEQDKCVHELFEEQVERTPEATAVVFEEEEVTYQELNQRANQLAHYLRKLGVGPEKLVGIYMERSIEMVVGILGILKAGGAYVPLDPNYPQERLNFMLEDTQMSVLLTQEYFVSTVLHCDATICCLDRDWSTIASESDKDPISNIHDSNLAYVIYTSGSTGQPKGAMNVHSALRNRILWMQSEYQLNQTDRVLQKTPFTFDVSVWEFLWPFITGAGLVVAVPEGHKDRDYLVETISRYEITTLHFVPSMLQIFLEAKKLETCSSLKHVICSGEALPLDLQERFFKRLQAQLHNLYGPTEAAIDVTYWPCTPDSSHRCVPIGYPIANTRIYLLDAWLNPVPIGVSGELHIGGVGLARGYFNRPGLTAEKFISDPFNVEPNARLYKTGDLARFLPDGSIEFLGRLDFQVKIRGFRIELGEIEITLSQHPLVREVVVTAQAGLTTDARLLAYIVPENEQSPTADQLRHFLKQKLPEYMVPLAFVLLESFPLLPNGKINRRLLPEPDSSRPVITVPFVKPGTSSEKTIANIWSEVLEIEQVGMHDNFFDLGGHSLLVAQVKSRIDSAFQIDMPLRTFFEYPTIASLSLEVVQQKAQQKDAVLLSQLLAEVENLSEDETKRISDR